MILINYLLFFISFIYNFIKYFFFINPSFLGLFINFITLLIGILWAYTVWQTFLFIDFRIIFIILCFVYFYIDYFYFFTLIYKLLFFFIFLLHFFILKIKLNWLTQLHQSNQLIFFFYSLPFLDTLFISCYFITMVIFLIYIYLVLDNLKKKEMKLANTFEISQINNI